jgi:hypothetical protein
MIIIIIISNDIGIMRGNKSIIKKIAQWAALYSYSSRNIIKVIDWRMGWARNLARVEIQEIHRIWKYWLETNLREIICEDIKWIKLAQIEFNSRLFEILMDFQVVRELGSFLPICIWLVASQKGLYSSYNWLAPFITPLRYTFNSQAPSL